MKRHEEILYIEVNDFLLSKWKQQTIWQANLRNGYNWQMIPDPMHAAKVLVKFDTLTDAHKQKLNTHFAPNVYEYHAKQPIKDMVQKDMKAESWYIDFRYDDDDALTPAKIKEYTTAASWLNMIATIQKEKIQVVKKTLGLKDIAQFYIYIGELIRSEKIGIPSAYKNLLKRLIEYQKDGYLCLVHKGHGCQNASKITDELSESMLKELMSKHQQYDYKLVAVLYNSWALRNGYKDITSQTAANWYEKRKPELEGERFGQDVYNSNSRRKVMRMLPSYPNAFWESDDNHLDLWFQGEMAKAFEKMKGIFVMDSHCEYIMGYYATDGELTADCVRLAYIDAMYHCRQLTGGTNWYLPFETKTDRWSLKNLQPFYEGIGHYFPTPKGSKNRGWIENFFGHVDWGRSLKLGNNNYTGHNITAKKSGVNMEVVKAAKKEWPMISQGGEQVSEFVQRLRLMPRNYEPSNISRQEQWLNSWANMKEEKKIPITDEQFLMKFGFLHCPKNGNYNSITDQGIRCTIMGKKYAFAVPPNLFRQNNGKKVQLVFDPYNMNRVLVTDGEELRFVAHSMTPVAGCMADMKEHGGRALLNNILAEAKQDTVDTAKAIAKRKKVISDYNMDVEDIIKLGASVPKEVKQWAEQRFFLPETARQIEDIDHEPVTEETEFNLYATLLKR